MENLRRLLETDVHQDGRYVKVVAIQLETQNQDAVKLLIQRGNLIN